MNNNFKKLNGKINQNNANKNFSVYGASNSLSDAMKIATEFHKQKNKKYKDLFLDKNEEKTKNESNKIKQNYEFSDEELKRRLEIAEEKNTLFKKTLNESSTINDILNGIISNLFDNKGED
jgi:hypothetical protein